MGQVESEAPCFHPIFDHNPQILFISFQMCEKEMCSIHDNMSYYDYNLYIILKVLFTI